MPWSFFSFWGRLPQTSGGRARYRHLKPRPRLFRKTSSRILHMYKENTWCLLQGSSKAELYALVHKPSITCSNSFAVKTDEHLLLIDPGKGDRQLKRINRLLDDLESEKKRAITIILTHCHVDHFLNTFDIMESRNNFHKLICHHEADTLLKNKDMKVTLAEMHNISYLPSFRVDLPLFSENAADVVSYGSADFDLQHLGADQGITIKALHTPGHSPDGTCFQIADCLFVGDMPFATNLGVAGMAGWNNEHLITSYENILHLGENEKISSVFTGHGNILSWEKASRLFKKAIEKATGLIDLVTFDNNRVDELMEYPVILLNESQALLSTISAMLLKVSEGLSLLGEDKESERFLNKLDIDSIDRLIDELYDFTVDFKANIHGPKKVLLLKANKFIQKVNRAIDYDKLSPFIYPFLLHRLDLLFVNFINSVYGITFDNNAELDVDMAIREVLSAIDRQPYSQESLFESLDDHNKFLNELSTRMAFNPWFFDKVRIDYTSSGSDLSIPISNTLFEDILLSLLLDLIASGKKEIRIALLENKDNARIEISPKDGEMITMAASRREYIGYIFKLHKGNFHQKEGAFVLEFPKIL